MAPLTKKTLRTAPLAALALALVTAQADAQTMVRLQEAGFKLKKRSLWKNAAYYGNDVLYGVDWDKRGSFGAIGKLDIPPISFGELGTTPGASLGETGVAFDYAVSGTLGLNCYAGAFGGEVDGDYSANLTYSYPLLVEAGKPITVRVTYRTNPNAHFDSSTPQYRAGVDLVARLDASLGGRGRFLDAKVFDDPNIMQGGVGGRKTLIGLSDLTQSNLPGLLGQFTPLGMQLSLPETATHGIYDKGGLTLKGSVYSPFVTFDTTLIGLLATFVSGGAGDALDFTAKDFSINAGPTNLNLSWKVASFGANQSYGLQQTVTLKDNPTVTLVGGTQVRTHTFTKDNESFDYQFTMPAAGTLKLRTQVTHAAKLDTLIQTGTSGALTFTPFALAFKGNLGSGPYAQSFDFSGKVDEQTLTSGSKPIQEVAHEPIDLTDADIVPSVVRDIEINPFDASTPSPAALWAGDLQTTVDGQVPYVQPPAYNRYTKDSGGIELFPAYGMTLVPKQGTAFNGISGNDRSKMQAYPFTWDGRLIGNLPSQQRDAFKVVQKGPTSINMNIPASLLRPGRHTLAMTVVGYFDGVQKIAHYDVPVVVRVPEPKIRSQVWNRIDFGESGGGFVINRFYYTTGTGTFWIKTDQTLLETEVVLDESIVLPSKKYVQLGSGGGPTTVTTDASGNYSDADELQFYTSGSSIVEFTLPAELNRKLNGGVHSLRLRTKDPVGTRIDQNPESALDTYTLSAQPGSSTDVPDTRFYFWSKTPTIAAVAHEESAIIPETPGAADLVIDGTEFTPTATVGLTVGGTTYPLPVEFESPARLHAKVPTDVLLLLQKGGDKGTLVVSTPTMTIPNTTLDNPILAGGTATKALTFAPLTPAVASVAPGSPVRGAAATLKITGLGFANSGTAAGTTQVAWNNTRLAVRFPGVGRDLKSLEVDLPASLLDRTGPQALTVTNPSGSGTTRTAKYAVTVSNAKPTILATTPLGVVVDDVTPVSLALAGGLFYRETTALVNGNSAKATLVDANHLSVDLAGSATNAATAKVSLLNPAPGGGQSDEIKVALYEGNVGNVKLVPGPKVFDRATGDYRQSFALTYTGVRDISRGARLTFPNLTGTGWTVPNQSGLDLNSKPYVKSGLVPRRQVTVVVTFHNILPFLNKPLDSTAVVGLNN